MNEYINLDETNIDKEHICCAIGDSKHQVEGGPPEFLCERR